MTAQFPEIVKYRGQEYSLAGAAGEGLFDPRRHGIDRPRFTGNSACDRAYVCFYEVRERQLVLDQLAILADRGTTPPDLFGVKPQPHPRQWLDLVYSGLSHAVSYTGGLVLGRSLVNALATILPFDGWKWREVHELCFEQGELIAELDRSADVEDFRRHHADLARTFVKRSEVPPWVYRYISPGYWEWTRQHEL